MTTQSNSIKEEKSIKYYLPHIFGGIILLALVALIALIIFDNTNKELYFAGGEDPRGSEYNPCEEGLKYCPPLGNSSLNFSLLGNRSGCCYDPKKYQCTNPFGGSGVCTCPKNNSVCINPLNPNQSICCAGSARDYFCNFKEQYGGYTIKCERRGCNLNQIPCTIDYEYNGINVTSSTCCDQEKTKACGYEEIKIGNETIYEPYCEETEECDSSLKQCENAGFRICCGKDTDCGIEKETNMPMCVPKKYNETFLFNSTDYCSPHLEFCPNKAGLIGGCCYDPEREQCTHPDGTFAVCSCPKNNLVCRNQLNEDISICCDGNEREYKCSSLGVPDLRYHTDIDRSINSLKQLPPKCIKKEECDWPNKACKKTFRLPNGLIIRAKTCCPIGYRCTEVPLTSLVLPACEPEINDIRI